MSNIPSEIQTVLREMRTRAVGHNGSTSPTLAAWADRIEAVLAPAVILERSRAACTDILVESIDGDVQDVRFPRGVIDAIKYADNMEEAAEGLHQHVFGYESDGEDCGTVILQRVLGYLKDSPKGGSDEPNTESRSVEDLARQLFMDHRDPTGKRWFTVADHTREEWRTVARTVRAGKSWE